ncbi:hypothetical protein ACFVWR_06940 [Leifsonia sp. NPDC058292]|uniref:hypothetical protein n=1 Tax=Leifsonia sp. NPDC058292 TaxID=3346428 RepID=UPI0036D82BBA
MNGYITLGVSIHFRGHEVVPLSETDGVIRIHDLQNDTEYDVLGEEILAERAEAQPAIESINRVSGFARSLTTEPWNLAVHLEEVLSGAPLEPGGAPRAQYQPDVPMMKRQASKREELEQLGFPMSLRTLQRHLYGYRDLGESWLYDRRRLPLKDPLRNVSPLLREAIESTKHTLTTQSTHTLAYFREEIRQELNRLGGENERLPSDPTLRHYLELIGGPADPFGTAKRRHSDSNRPTSANRASAVPDVPGSEVQIDTSRFDVEVLDGLKNRRTTAQLALMIDKSTRCIVGTTVRLRSMQGIDIALMIVESCMPRRVLPLDKALAERLVAGAWRRHFGEELPETRLPFIRPRTIESDNGADYLSQSVSSAMKLCGINHTEARPRTPTDKSLVERVFETIEMEFAQYMPGYLGSDVTNRGDRTPDGQLLTVFELAELFHVWCAHVYQNTRHSGLRSPWRPSTPHSPNTMLTALREFYPERPLPVPADYLPRIASVTQRVIALSGIQINYRVYDSPELDPFRLRLSPITGTSSWPIHYHPTDLGQVWVIPPGGNPIVAPLKDRDRFFRPFAEEIDAEARRIAAEARELSRADQHELAHELAMAAKSQVRARERHEARTHAAIKLDPGYSPPPIQPDPHAIGKAPTEEPFFTPKVVQPELDDVEPDLW